MGNQVNGWRHHALTAFLLLWMGPLQVGAFSDAPSDGLYVFINGDERERACAGKAKLL